MEIPGFYFPLEFCVKSILAISVSQKQPFLQFLGSEFLYKSILAVLKNAKIQQNEK